MTAPTDRSPAAALATTVVFAAFIAVLGIFPGLYVGGSGVPIVLQNIGPLLAGAILGARRGTGAVLLLLVLVAIGLPLLSGGRAGIAPFLGASGGFLLGWVLSALVTGLIVERALRAALICRDGGVRAYDLASPEKPPPLGSLTVMFTDRPIR